MRKIITLIMFLIMTVLPSFSKGIEVQRPDNGIYIFKISLDELSSKIKPYVAEELTTTSDVFNNKDLNFQFVVNGGFFNIKTGAPVSNAVIDGVMVESIYKNLELIKALDEQGRIEAILNRSELRIYEDKSGKLSFAIASHFAPPPNGLKIKHSLQGGPMLLPNLRLEEESFIKNKDGKTTELAASVLKRRERTIVGIKHGLLNKEYLYIIIFTKDSKLALNEVRDYCLLLGLDEAMAFDGGASTSVNYQDIEIYSASDGQRRVKTFLVIEN